MPTDVAGDPAAQDTTDAPAEAVPVDQTAEADAGNADVAAADQTASDSASETSAPSSEVAPEAEPEAPAAINGQDVAQPLPDAIVSNAAAAPMFEARWIDGGGAHQVRLFEGDNADVRAKAFIDGVNEDGRIREPHVANVSDF
jgi:uncharacterized protein YodC (DUF2158 family)